MTTDYDALRQRDVDEPGDDTLASLQTRRTERRSGVSDIGEAEVARTDGFASGDELRGFDEDLSLSVVPTQADEFVCSRCFLVRHRSRLARSTRRTHICRDCA